MKNMTLKMCSLNDHTLSVFYHDDWVKGKKQTLSFNIPGPTCIKKSKNWEYDQIFLARSVVQLLYQLVGTCCHFQLIAYN